MNASNWLGQSAHCSVYTFGTQKYQMCCVIYTWTNDAS